MYFRTLSPEAQMRVILFLTPFIILDLVLRGFALWRAARRGQKVWFIALLVVNSLGILPGIYLMTNTKSKSGENK
jgi:hypothetical protein